MKELFCFYAFEQVEKKKGKTVARESSKENYFENSSPKKLYSKPTTSRSSTLANQRTEVKE